MRKTQKRHQYPDNNVWFFGLSDDDKEFLARAFQHGGKRIIERLLELLEKEKEIINNFEISDQQFKEPNWEYRQAYLNGKKAMMGVMEKWLTTAMKMKL